MTKYHVHIKTDKEGDHEVHKGTCFWLPKQSRRVYLGTFWSCHPAVQ